MRNTTGQRARFILQRSFLLYTFVGGFRIQYHLPTTSANTGTKGISSHGYLRREIRILKPLSGNMSTTNTSKASFQDGGMQNVVPPTLQTVAKTIFSDIYPGIVGQKDLKFCNDDNGTAYAYSEIVDGSAVCQELSIPNAHRELNGSFFETRPTTWNMEEWYMWHGGGGYRWSYTDEFISLMICGPKGVVTRKLCNTPRRFNCARIV